MIPQNGCLINLEDWKGFGNDKGVRLLNDPLKDLGGKQPRWEWNDWCSSTWDTLSLYVQFGIMTFIFVTLRSHKPRCLHKYA